MSNKDLKIFIEETLENLPKEEFDITGIEELLEMLGY